nr:MAG TPA: hypothetical protein [Caudoviricetes sp.]
MFNLCVHRANSLHCVRLLLFPNRNKDLFVYKAHKILDKYVVSW